MIRKAHRSVVVVAAVLAVSVGQIVAQEGEKKGPEGGPDPAMMELWKKMAEPGEYHAYLKPLVGRWNLVVRYRMAPEQPWEESTATGEYKWILGGRFLTQQTTGEMMEGERFEGFGMTGYDKVTKQYVSVWADTYSTGFMISKGTSDSSGKVFTFQGEYSDPMTGQTKKARSIIRIINNNKHIFEMYDHGPDGKEFQNLEITYTRK